MAGVGGIIGAGFFLSFGPCGMVMLVWQEGQLMLRPHHSVAARMCWPQVGQLNLNSVLAGMVSDAIFSSVNEICELRSHANSP